MWECNIIVFLLGASPIDAYFDDHYANIKFSDSVELNKHQDEMLVKFLYDFLDAKGPSYAPLFVHKLTRTNILNKELVSPKNIIIDISFVLISLLLWASILLFFFLTTNLLILFNFFSEAGQRCVSRTWFTSHWDSQHAHDVATRLLSMFLLHCKRREDDNQKWMGCFHWQQWSRRWDECGHGIQDAFRSAGHVPHFTSLRTSLPYHLPKWISSVQKCYKFKISDCLVLLNDCLVAFKYA